jgi:predicted dithiol-disulfide oxidoreductase (DUF899 family)
VSYAVVARAPIAEIKTVRERRGWRFTWVSSYHSEFNYDFHGSFTPKQIATGRALYNYNYEYVNPGLEDLSPAGLRLPGSSARRSLGSPFHGTGSRGNPGFEVGHQTDRAKHR